jgi:hypothetical protein
MRKLTLTAVALVLVMGASPAEAATSYSNLFVFGDSLRDKPALSACHHHTSACSGRLAPSASGN